MAKDCLMHLNQFLGLHLPEDGNSKLAVGESPYMKNFKIVPGYQLRRRDGYRVLHAENGSVRTLWQGVLNTERLYLALIGETLYSSADAFETLQAVGTVPGTERVSVLEFREKLYFLTGQEILCFDGTGLSEVEAYRPLIRIGTPPTGGGTVFEDANLLTGKLRQSFSPEASSSVYVLALDHLDSIDYITVNGGPVDLSTCSLSPEAGTIEFGEPPEEGIPDSVEIGYTKTIEGRASKILHCRFGISYGGENDTRAFLWGNPFYPAMRFYSGISNGLPDFGYFPESNFSLIGDGEKITDMIRHYDRQIIFTSHAAYYSYPETATDETGKSYLSFPVYTLSAMKGSIAEHSSSLIENKPFSIMPDGLYLWSNTSIRDERNATCFTQRIAAVFPSLEAENALYFNRSSKKELLIVCAGGIYVYNYLLDVFYYYEIACSIPNCFLEDDRTALFFGTSDGKLCAVGGAADGENPIEAVWESNNLDFGQAAYTKNLISVTLKVAPFFENFATLAWQTESAVYPKQREESALHLGKRLFGFSHPDFSEFSFEISHHSRSFTKRINIKRFSYLKLIIKHQKINTNLHLFGLLFRGKINDQRI